MDTSNLGWHESDGRLIITNLPSMEALAAEEYYTDAADVPYADEGYQPDGKKRYPIDTEEHVRAAWNYFSKPSNSSKYTPAQRAKIRAKIISAWKRKIDPKGPPSA